MRACRIIAMMGLFMLSSAPLTAATITLAWDASVGATAYQIYHGPASGDYRTVVPVGHVTTATIDGLASGQTYYFAATAVNGASESGFSNEVSAMATTTPASDTTPPTVVLTSPGQGNRVPRNGDVVMRATASDDTDLQDVRFYVNGTLRCTQMTAPYECVWRVPSARKRTYDLHAVARDAAGHATNSAVVRVTSR